MGELITRSIAVFEDRDTASSEKYRMVNRVGNFLDFPNLPSHVGKNLKGLDHGADLKMALDNISTQIDENTRVWTFQGLPDVDIAVFEDMMHAIATLPYGGIKQHIFLIPDEFGSWEIKHEYTDSESTISPEEEIKIDQERYGTPLVRIKYLNY